MNLKKAIEEEKAAEQETVARYTWVSCTSMAVAWT